MPDSAETKSGWLAVRVGRLAHFSVVQRRWVFVAVLLLSTAAGLAIPRLGLQKSIYGLFPSKSGPIADLAHHARSFSAGGELLILVSASTSKEAQETAAWLRKRLGRSKLIKSVGRGSKDALVSYITKHVFVLLDDQDWSEVRRRFGAGLPDRLQNLRRALLAPIGPDPVAVRDDPLGLSELVARRLKLASKTEDRPSAHALVFAKPIGPSSDLALCASLDRLLGKIAAEKPISSVTLRFGGAYRYSHFLARQLKRDLTVSSVAALVLVSFSFFIFFRSLRLLPIAATVAALAVGWTLAIATFVVRELNALSLAFAAICVGLGVDAAIHYVSRLRTTKQGDGAQRLRLAMSAVGPALIASVVSTIIAFASFGLSTFAGLAQTGMLAAIGLGISLLLTMTVFPALASLSRLPTAQRKSAIDTALAALARLVSARPRLLAFVVLVVAGGAFALSPPLRFEGRLASLIPEDLPPLQTDRAIAAAYGRAQNRLIVLTRATDRQRALLANDRLAAVLYLLQRKGLVESFASVSGLLPARATQRARLVRLNALVAQSGGSARLSRQLKRAGFAPASFSSFLTRVEGRASLGVADLPSAIQQRLKSAIAETDQGFAVATTVFPRDDAAAATITKMLAKVAAQPATIRVTGAAMVEPAIASVLQADLLLIVIVCLLAVTLVLIVLLRRPWPIAATLISLTAAGASYCALISALNLPVDLYTLMTIPLIIGYGVDDHLYIARHALTGGIDEALRTSGRAVLATTATSGAAFLALALCELAGLRALGYSAALGFALAMIASMVLLPALLSLGKKQSARLA